MSRVGKVPIAIPDGVSVNMTGSAVMIKGPKGELSKNFHPESKIDVKDNEIVVQRKSNSKFHRALHGTTRALLNNMVRGVSEGFEKQLDIVGVGFRVESKGKFVQFSLGYSHAIYFYPPEGIQIAVNSQNSLTVKGIDKQLVGHVASKVRSLRPPEPYKGKGIKYSGEYIKRKAGKTGAKVV